MKYQSSLIEAFLKLIEGRGNKIISDLAKNAGATVSPEVKAAAKAEEKAAAKAAKAKPTEPVKPEADVTPPTSPAQVKADNVNRVPPSKAPSKPSKPPANATPIPPSPTNSTPVPPKSGGFTPRVVGGLFGAGVVGGVIGGAALNDKGSAPSATAAPAPSANNSSEEGGVTVVPQTNPGNGKKPVAKSAPAQKPAASPETPKNDNPYGYARPGSDEDTAANFFTADAARMKAQGQKAPNDFSDSAVGRVAKSIEDSSANKWMNKTFGGKSVSESSLIDSFLKSDPSKNLFSEAKKAKKDWDKDGKVESDKDEVWGSRFAAAKKAGKMEEATSSDPDFAAPRPDGTKKPDDIQYKPEDKKPEDKVPLPPKRPSGLKEAYLKILRGE